MLSHNGKDSMFLLLLTKPSYKDRVLDQISVIKSKTIVARLFGNEALEISSETRRGERENGRTGEGEKEFLCSITGAGPP